MSGPGADLSHSRRFARSSEPDRALLSKLSKKPIFDKVGLYIEGLHHRITCKPGFFDSLNRCLQALSWVVLRGWSRGI
jgi:hypothetical protein